MNIIQPSVRVMDWNNIMQNIELGGRVCYRSEDKMCEGSDVALIEKLLNFKHESVLEHGVITINIVCDRGVSHELVRQRLASPSQESTRYCVAGDTVLTTTNPHNKLTVADLYANKGASTNGAWKRMKIRQLNEVTGELQYGGVSDVFSMGKKPVIRVKTKLGYELVLTPDHEIYTREGYIKAGELTLSSDIAVNGVAALYQSEPWLRHQYTALNKTAVAIAKEFDFNVSTIKKWVRKHSLPAKPKSYWNIGREAWNKGMDESDPRVAKQADALREHHWDEGRYTEKSAKDRVSKLSERTYGKMIGEKCELCGETENLHVHHVDEDRCNNVTENLLTVCASCHQRLHAKNLLAVTFDRVVEIEDAGVTEVFDISMASAFHNFVANGVIVHNCNYSKGKFGSEITVIEPFFYERGSTRYRVWEEACIQAGNAYLRLVQEGSSAQEARSVLPNSLKTEIQITANIRQWRHILTLRTHRDAHPQMRQIMVPLGKVLAEKWPVLFGGFAEVEHPRPAVCTITE